MLARSLLFFAGFLFAGNCLFAGTFTLDPDTSQFGIDVKASPPHSFTVWATSFEAAVEIGDDGRPVQADFSFAFADLDSDNGKRDAKMLRWIESEKYPDMSFRLKRVEEDESGLVAIGDVTMHGESRQVRVPFTIETEGDRTVIEGSASLNYQEWNLEIITLLFFKVKPDLEIHFKLGGVLK